MERTSLVGKVIARFRRTRLPSVDIRPRMSGLIAAMLVSAPLSTIAVAALLQMHVRNQTDALAERTAPLRVAAEDADRTRDQFRRAVRRPTLGVTVDRLSRALPQDAQIVRASRAADGSLSLQIATPDPDQLRAALRQDRQFASLRDVGQERGVAGMLVSLRGAP